MVRVKTNRSVWDAAYYQRNKEKILAKNAVYRLTNQEHICAQRLTTRKKRLVRQKAYNASHKAKHSGRPNARNKRLTPRKAYSMETESPWPIDPTPGDMAYVGVCPECHGLTFVCATDHLAAHVQTLLISVKHGDDLHRVPTTDLYKTGWQFCHCGREEEPHG